MALNIKINKSLDSVLEKIELVEHIDTNLLDQLINSNLLQTTSWDAGLIKFDNEKHQLQLLKKQIKGHKLKVVYKKPKYGYGRVFPEKGLSLCSLRREIRHTLAYEKYTDIDIENCHPQILKQICEHNKIRIKYLKQYVDNRESILLDTQAHYNCNREDAKKLFIILAYYGSFNTWVSDINTNNTEPTDFIQDYINELKSIGQKVAEENPDLIKVVKGLEKKNETGSVVSIFLQEKERLILEVIYTHLLSKGLITDKNAVLCFDGIMIQQTKYYTDLLDELSQVVYNYTGLKLKFTQKNLDQHYLNDLNNELDEDSFEFKKVEFEKNHCKIVNKSVFVKQTDDEIIFFSKQQLKVAYEHMTCGEKKSGEPKLFIDQWCIGNESIRKYDNFNSYPYPLKCPDNILNLWIPFECERYTESYKSNCNGLKLILNHIKILCGNDDKVHEYFLQWIGQMIQYPAIKTICPTLISKQGAGKGTLNKLIQKMLGSKKCLETTNPGRDVWGQFNSVMTNAFFVNLNELSKKDTIEAEGKIKGLITDGTLTINGKGTNQFEINSYHRFLTTTNSEDPVKTSKDDRRNLIIRSSDEKIGDKSYFKNLHDALEDINVIRTCYDFFKMIPNLNEFNKIPIPETEYHNNLKLLDRSPPEQFLIDFCNINEGTVELLGKDIYNQFVNWTTENNIEYNTNPLKFAVKLSNLKIDGVEKGKHTKKGDTRLLHVDKIRKHFKLDQDRDIFTDEVVVEAPKKIKTKRSNLDIDFGDI